MNDELEVRLGAELRALVMPAAPDHLRDRVRAIPREPAGPARPSRPSRWRHRQVALIAAGLAVVIAGVLGAMLLSGAGNGQPSLPVSTPSASARALASLPTTVDGQAVLSVGTAIRNRDAGLLGRNPVAIGGFWSDGSVGHSCAAPDSNPGDLEIYCHDGKFGITQLEEPIEVIDQFGFTTQATGPALTPYIANDLEGANRLFGLPIINGQRFPPTPILVVGHFDDLRAAACRAVAKDICRNRLVIDRIVQFDPDAMPTPAPTPTPTPFPVEDPPPAPYTAADCLEGNAAGFQGWTTLRSLGIDIAFPDMPAYIVISKDPMVIGDWFDDPNGSGRYRLWGQRVCYGYLEEEGAIGYTALPGTAFREYEDGRRVPTQGP